MTSGGTAPLILGQSTLLNIYSGVGGRGHSDIGDLVVNWPHLFKVKKLYLVGMFVLLHVLVFR